MATIDQVTAWNSSKPRSEGYYQYDGDSGDFVFYGADGNVAADPHADPIEAYLKQYYDAATDTYDIPNVGKVNYAGPWSTSQNLKAFGPMSTPETYRAGMFENGGQVIDTPFGPAFVGVSRRDAPEGSAQPGAGFGGMLPLMLAGGIGAAGGAAGFGLGGFGGAEAGLGGLDFLAANDAAMGGFNFLGANDAAMLAGEGAVFGGAGAGAGGASGLDAIMSGWNPAGDLAEYAGYTAGNTVPTGAAGAGTAAQSGSALSRLLDGTATTADKLDLMAKLGSTGLGLYGASQQAGAANDLYDRFFSLGAPYRQSLAALEANPQGFYSSPMVQGALQQGSDALSRSLSAKVGNPILNPTALQEMQNYTSRGLLDAYNNRFSQLASAGQLGVSQSAGLGSQAASAQSGIPNALGAGLSSVFGQEQNYTQQLLDLLKNRPSLGGVSLP